MSAIEIFQTQLSKREKEVLQAFYREADDKNLISKQLNISPATYRAHMGAIYAAFNISGRNRKVALMKLFCTELERAIYE